MRCQKKLRGILYVLIDAAGEKMRNRLSVIISIIIILFFLTGPGMAEDQFLWLVKPRFEKASFFSEGLAAVKINGDYGYINSSGELIIKPVFDLAGDFNDGAASVIKNGRQEFVNRKGISLIAHKEDERLYFGEGLAVIKINSKYGYIKSNGEIFLKPLYEDALSFSEDFASVKINGKYGYINKKGKIVIKPSYQKASIFSEGLAAVKIDDRWGYINKKGRMVLIPLYAEAGDFSEGVAPVRTDSGSGYINTRGLFVIKPQLEGALPFSENIAAVKLNGEWGYIRRPVSSKVPAGIKSRVTVTRSASGKDKIPDYSNEKSEQYFPVKNFNVKKKDEIKKISEPAKNSEKVLKNSVALSGDKEVNHPYENISGTDNNDNYKFSSGEKNNNSPVFKTDESENKVIIDRNIPVIKGMEFAGILSEMNAGQVIVTDVKTGEKVYLGAWCITKVEGDRVYIEAGTPSSMVAKCDFKNGFYEKIKPGMMVYKKNK